MKRLQFRVTNRRGSTLMIVLALLSLLMFLGMVFYTFAAQERAAADYFSEAAKSDVQVDDDPFPWGMEQLLTGAKNHQKQSVYWGPRSRHSMVRGVVGYDAVPHNGSGVNVIYNAAEIPEVDQDYDGTGDGLGAGSLNNPLNFVDSLVVWPATGGITPAEQEQQVTNVRGQFPEPDVDYTYPDINNIWLAYRGWAVRDNGAAAGAQRYQRVPVFIPSFMRPALLKSGTANGFGGNHAITDLDWYDHNVHPAYAKRSFRPSEDHIAGYDGSGNPIRRYIDQTNAADAALIATYGAFPLRPNEDVNPATFGELGLLTGHAPGTIDSPINFRLDSDNDGDGVFEGIWMDLGYPVQETASGDLYATLYSFTIYDLGSLIDLNSHGNISELVRTEAVTDQIAGGGGSTLMDTTLLSASDQGLSPSEVSPLWALAPIDPADLSTDPEFTDGLRGYGAAPTTRLEQANMEWLWLLTGRIDDTDQVWDGRWGDANALWLHVHGTDGSAGSSGARDIATLPRPGRAGRLPRITTNLIRFGDNEGFDDNADALLGVAHQRTGVLRGFVHPLNIGGVGQSTESADPRLPRMARPDATVPDQWPQYFGYSLTGSGTNVFNEKKYLSGVDGTLSLAGDDLIDSPRYNIGFEDPDEMVNDVELAVRPDDAIFSSADIVPAHLSGTDVTSALSTLSVRLSNLATQAFASGSNISERFTTISNNLRTIPHRHDLGPNLESDGGTGDDGPRWWEWSADADGDNRLEFPPQFGTVPLFKPYIQSEAVPAADPFRATVRRLLTTEAGESRKLTLQLPLSINHILDVNRTEDTPPETSPRFLEYLQRAGMRFRPLTEHPLASETSGGTTFSSLTDVPLADSPAGTALLQQFPPQTFAAREFWARRDRQKLARDIYVLLYTIGGGEVLSGQIKNATSNNNTRGIYTDEQMRRMAQFAVNMVDAMDADDVVTMFEYDKNLSDGWNLDDDPLTQNPAFGSGTVDDNDRGMYPFDAGDRGVVFGVEAQQLTLSESLAVRMEDFAKWNGLSDDSTTLFNDASGTGPLADPDNERRDRYMLHLELQNQQPYPVPLSVNGVTGTTNGEQAIWQLARVDRDSAVDAVQEPTLDPMASVSTPDGTTMSFMDGNTDIQGGQRFSIAMATVSNTNPGDSLRTDPLEIGTADLYLQKPTATDYALISPDEPGITITGGAAVSPHCHLDTISTAHDGRYIYDDTVSDKGHFLREIPYADNGISYHGNEPYDFVAATQDNETSAATGQGFDVVLRRRMNPNLPLLPLAQNPWIEVDRTRVEFKDLFEISTSGMTVTATPDFANIESSERQEPLDAGSSGENHPPASTDPATDNYRYNTIAYSASSTSGANDITTAGSGVFNLWQPHFDRDFSSVVELFQLPVIGPRLLTQRLDRMRYAPFQQVFDDPLNPPVPLNATADPDLLSNAVSMFLQPDWPSTDSGAQNRNRNAWYRLLQFLEVPSRVNSMLGNYLTRPTLPGKININGIRHIEVYAGLIDDNVIGQVPLAAVNAAGNDVGNHFHPFMVDATPGVGVTSLPTSGGGSNNLDSRDRWIELLMERDGATEVHDPVNNQLTMFWVPGTPNAKPFRSLGYRTPQLSSGSDASLDDTILRRLSADSTDGADETNRHWMEVGGTAFHNTPNTRSTQIQRHQVLGRIINNTTTVSNSFIVYGTAAYFRAYEHSSGLIRIGRRMGLDIDNDSDERNDAGWEKRAVFIIDRTELLNAHDEGTGSFDWQRLIKYRADLPSDSQ